MNRNNTTHQHSSIRRILFVGISVLAQAGWLLLLILRLNKYYAALSLLTGILALVAVLRIHSHHTNTALKTPWIMLILAFPVMGISLYLLFETLGHPRYLQKRLRNAQIPPLPQPPSAEQNLEQADPAIANHFRYLMTHGNAPVYQNTRVEYYPESVLAFQAMKQDLAQAKHFIFMEYFILEDGASFAELREILVQKAQEGVEVRLMYDDFGSIGSSDLRFARELRQDGIRCQVFNPAVPVLKLFMNQRDHRKITVIDGKVGFTGGYNLSDEYFGKKIMYGHWKDLGLRLEGQAVQSLTAIFLELWDFSARSNGDNRPFLDIRHTVPGNGFVQPYRDSPIGSERFAENVYLNLISSATSSLWFMTPYLIITDEMTRALQLAAKRGVDVRIITPGVPDKKTVYALTRSYYSGLASQGVRIFEYTPGFCHGKLCICDERIASIGTSNLDYRSLYLHFENNVLLCHCPAVDAMVADMKATFLQCREVTEQYCCHSGFLHLWQCILRLFAPLM